MADVRITQYPLKSIISDNDIFLIADSNDIDVNGFPKYKKVRAKDLPSIVNTAENITYANLMASIAANDLIIGTFYRITDSTSGVSPLLVQAVGVNAISYQAFDGANPLNTINYNVATDTIRWNKNETNPPQDYLSGSGIVKSTAGTISYLTDNSTNWNTAFNDSIVSAAVTGSATKTLTLNQQDGGTVTASWSDIDTGLTSVGLTMPSAFTVSNSPLTANGTLAVTGAGVASQYVRGDGTLAAFPTSTGGGSSVSYYFNGGTNQGTIGGNTYYEMSKTAVIGVGADFNISSNGYVAQFVTDANDPALLSIPAGNWNFEMWFSASSNGGSPSFYLELYKYDGATLTLISSGSAVPESITGGTAIDLYTTALAVPLTSLTITDRLAVRVFVNNSSRTITLHTQNGHLCQAITTFSTGLTALNGLTNQVQYFAVGTSGTDFAISSATDTHTFNLPTASAANRGALSSADWTTFSAKIGGTGTTNYLPKFTGASALGNSLIFDNGTNIGINTTTPATKLDVVGSVADTAVVGGITVEQTTLFRPSNSAGGLRTGFNTTGGDVYVWSSTSGASLNFGTRVAPNNNVGMTLLSSGNFGIGTTAPASKLDVQVSTAGTSIIGYFNNNDFTAANKSVLRVRQQTGVSTGFSGYFGMDGNVLFLSNDTTATRHLAISTTGAATFSSSVTAGLSSATGTQLTLNALYSNGITFLNTNVGVDNRNFRIITDQGVYGTFNIQKSTTQGGSTYANILSFDQNSVATFSADATINGVKVGRGGGNIATNTAVGASALNANTTGANNIAIGLSSLTNNTTGGTNTAIGNFSLATNTTGINNAAFGFQSLVFNVTGSANTAIGRDALQNNTASNNTAVGFEAALTNTSGTDITAIGYRALKFSTGVSNTAVGSNALTANTTGANNTALGSGTLIANTTGATNTAVGVNALTVNTTGSQNTSVGVSSLSANNTGSQNTAIGRSALFTNTTGLNNTGLGYQALYFNSIGSNNTALGAAALLNNTANNNTAVGFEAATNNTTGAATTAIGYQALKINSTGANNTAVGSSALGLNTTGQQNTSVGSACLVNNTTGNDNTAIGVSALQSVTTASNNTAVGRLALGANTAANNTAVGFESSYLNTTGTGIVSVGYQALRANTGIQNTGIGFQSLLVNTTGTSNTSLGFQSLVANTTGAVNTAIGNGALSANTTGASNSALGVGTQSGNFNASVILGRDATATASNQFVVGSASYPAGAVATEVNASSKVWNVVINGVAQKILLA
jgi:hypothetical protein